MNNLKDYKRLNHYEKKIYIRNGNSKLMVPMLLLIIFILCLLVFVLFIQVQTLKNYLSKANKHTLHNDTVYNSTSSITQVSSVYNSTIREVNSSTEKTTKQYKFLSTTNKSLTNSVQNVTLAALNNTRFPSKPGNSSVRFVVTAKPGDWYQCSSMCTKLGGNLLSRSLKDQRFKKDLLKIIQKNNNKNLWVGLTDSQKEGDWRLLDGSKAENLTLDWSKNEPNDYGSDENCASIVKGTFYLNDLNCDQKPFSAAFYGYRYALYGLCEIFD